jgi:NAD(P)-dependent dehydrogenase (short-subunit alcohol dehydrogenase family)
MELQEYFSLKGKTAIITGSSKGIGEAIAYFLGKAGANIVLSSRKQEAVEEVAERFRAEGINCLAVACQMGDMDAIDALVKATVDAFGTIDIVINNAATNPVFGPITEADFTAYDKIMDVNVKGPLHLSKLAYPYLKKSDNASVINISSVEGISPGFGLGLYSISKASLIMLSKVLAKEWGQEGIRVNTICPGLIKTKFSKALWSNDSIMKQVMAKQPIKDIGKPEDIGALALMLASKSGAYCTGAVFTADGGLTI